MTSGAVVAANLCEAFGRTSGAKPDAIALQDLTGERMTWQTYAARVARLAAGLHSSGLRPGDTLGLLLRNRPEFHLLDTAALHLGAIPFSIYNTSAPSQIAHVLGHAECTTVATEVELVPRLRSAGYSGLDKVIVVDHPAGSGLDDLEVAGADGFDLEAAARSVHPDDVATLIYTSGTTGPPKGVELTHSNLLADWHALGAVLPHPPGGRVLSYLPAAHIADRFVAHYGPMLTGACTTTVANLGDLPRALRQVRPTLFGTVPRVLEKLRASLADVDPAGLDGEAAAQLRARIGLDQVHWVCTGAAPIQPSILEFFSALDLPISECFGMSEIGCIVTANPLDTPRFGTVGRALPGVDIKLAPDGELLVRGPTVMRGYHNDPQATAAAFDDDGYLRSGDLATIDVDGYITIVGRKKELIINAAGKNMSPATIERQILEAGKLISQVCVIGDRRPYNVALVTLHPDQATRPGLDPAALTSAVADQITTANRQLSRIEQIKHFQILETEWLAGGDELTPTMKLKRGAIADNYADTINQLYSARA